jgi:hypothetical protein
MSLSSIMRKGVATVKGLFSPEGNTARNVPAHSHPLQVKQDTAMSTLYLSAKMRCFLLASWCFWGR